MGLRMRTTRGGIMNRIGTCTRAASALIGTVCAVVLVAGSAQAQTYPSRPIEFISPTSPGAGTDLFMRAITGMLEKEKIFSQPALNSNRVGGAGIVAYNYIR